ncbi:8304_t:CDS:2 [Ambispora leptoticha]|uniref:Diacylglycerol O-acyltransferase n=1 Tax=Ambispora leptoticha TaxID=144679 RepID=A0A9N8WF07_9GLOM|nr:8304_t:CDS:2 [Ambispora leptoticha]
MERSKPRVRVAPMNVPFERRRQTAAVFIWLASLPFTLFVTRKWWTSRRIYAKTTLLEMQADLDPTKNYVFGYHPHGVISVGAWTNFATEANNCSKLFPGIKFHLLTLASNFNIPLYRDYIMAQGCASVSRQSCENILKGGPGSSIIIVVGGAGESLNAHPGHYDLTLKKRLGFIKLAIRNGASLCPIFSFGENDIWEQVPNDQGTPVWKLQKHMQKMLGFTLPLFHGRGVFNYDIGMMPHRRPIVTIVGKPIPVEQNDNPTEEEILSYQKKYIEELYDIWNKYCDVHVSQILPDPEINPEEYTSILP